MPVVIDEMQLVTDPATTDRAAGATVPAPAAPAAPPRREVERVLERRLERLARLRAH